MNSKLLVMKMNNLREDYKKLELMLQKEFLIMKTRLLYCPNNLKDSTELLKERITKSELWEVKSKMPNKISDFQLLKHQSLVKSSKITEISSKHQMKNQKPTD